MSVVAAVLRDDASYTAVLRAAAQLAGAEPFVVLSMFPLPPAEYQEVVFESPAETTSEARDAVKREIEADLKTLSLKATVEVPIAKTYNLGDNIVARAQEAGASTIVIGTHGRTGLNRLFVGSVAERVVRHADCDVYVVRPPHST
jgi:nucleotide-binding universal stress UspA family protein